jgi:hypothetical protein
MGRPGDLVALLLRHVQPEPGQCRIEFLPGHVRPPNCMAGRDAASRTQQGSDDLVKHRHNEKASTDAQASN